MHCINCGDKLEEKEKFCTGCGKEALDYDKLIRFSQKKPHHWKAVVITFIASWFLWWVYYYGFVDRSSQSAGMVSHLLETVGRQSKAWDKSEQRMELVGAAFSDECINTPGCIDEIADRMTVLRAEMDKEREEIGNLWAEEVIGRDFAEYYSSLDDKDKARLLDVLKIYFPEETEKLEKNNLLL